MCRAKSVQDRRIPGRWNRLGSAADELKNPQDLTSSYPRRSPEGWRVPRPGQLRSVPKEHNLRLRFHLPFIINGKSECLAERYITFSWNPIAVLSVSSWGRKRIYLLGAGAEARAELGLWCDFLQIRGGAARAGWRALVGTNSNMPT